MAPGEAAALDVLLRAMLDAPWAADEGGIPSAYSEDCRSGRVPFAFMSYVRITSEL